jgi:hypothetical protein
MWGIAAGLGVLAGGENLFAQATIYPQKLYSGMNQITVTAGRGLAHIQRYDRGVWRDFLTGAATTGVRVVSGPTFNHCARSATFLVFVSIISRDVGMRLRVVDCEDDDEEFDLRLSERWNVFHEDFGPVRVGEPACHPFSVDPRGNQLIIDSIVSPSPLFVIRYTDRPPPLRVAGRIYHYDVCLKPIREGEIARPILVYIRRDQPAGGYTNFIVADTAYVNALPPIARVLPRKPAPPARPAPKPPLLNPPPQIVLEPPPPPIVMPPDITATQARREAFAPPGPAPDPPAIAREEAPTLPLPEFLTDPTPFRTILLPTAAPVERGRFFLANYEVAGFLAGYGATDRLTLLAGFFYVPATAGSTIGGTAGGKYELYNEGLLRGSVGMEFNISSTPLSSITLLSPYAVASYGDDDHRLNLALGYSWRHHRPAALPAFDRQAAVLGLGGDYRIGFHWKLAAELALLENSDVQPLLATVRYFSDVYTVDVGLGVNMNPSGSGLRVAPVVNVVRVW